MVKEEREREREKGREGGTRGGVGSDWNDPCFNGEVYRGKLSGVPGG